MRVRTIVTDIEGTTTPIAFVKDVLFPYSRRRMAAYIERHRDDPVVAESLAEVVAAAPEVDPLATLLAWLDADAKTPPLKALQGLIWREGFARGELRGEVYPDVPPALRAWHGAGLTLAVYSSGSETAQRQVFGHTAEGDLTPLFAAFFDTRTGNKREPDSYRAIAGRLGAAPETTLFLSDVAEELRAAGEAGWQTMQLLRPQDGTRPAPGFAQAEDFSGVTAAFDLPAGPA